VTIKFMSVDAAQFCSCENPINYLLSMNIRAPADACFVQTIKHDNWTFTLSCENLYRTHIISLVLKYV